MASSTAIALAKVRATAIRDAMRAISDEEDLHDGDQFGPEACLGCRWRQALGEYADLVEHEADDEQGDTDG